MTIQEKTDNLFTEYNTLFSNFEKAKKSYINLFDNLFDEFFKEFFRTHDDIYEIYIPAEYDRHGFEVCGDCENIQIDGSYDFDDRRNIIYNFITSIPVLYFEEKFGDDIYLSKENYK